MAVGSIMEMVVNGRRALVYRRSPSDVSSSMYGDTAPYIIVGYIDSTQRWPVDDGAVSSLFHTLVAS